MYLEHKDVFGTPIQIGDTVATNFPGYTYTLITCTVIGFTPKMVRVEYKYQGDKVGEYLKFPKQLAVKTAYYDCT